MLKTPAVYTLETSLCGGAIDGKMPHFTPIDLQMIGKYFCLAVLVFHDVSFDLEKNHGIPNFTKDQAVKELMISMDLLGMGDRFTREDNIMSSGSGSDSDPT